MENYSTSGHFAKALPRGEADETIRQCVEALKGVEFDSFAFCGLSGAVIAPILAYRMGKELIMIRKNGGNDGSHSKQFAEGFQLENQRIIIIDDLVCSWETMKNIVKGLNRFIPNKRYELVGYVLYDEGRRYGSIKLQMPNMRLIEWKETL